MKSYKHILLALELVPESDKAIIQKTKKLLEKSHATLTLVHTVEHFSNFGAAYNIPGGMDVEEELVNGAKEALAAIAKKFPSKKKNQIVKVGSAKQVILEAAKKKRVDLIVIGSHGRRGIQLLLGSTANSVIQEARCDVLAVRVP